MHSRSHSVHEHALNMQMLVHKHYRAHIHAIDTVQPWGCFQISMLTSLLCFSLSSDGSSEAAGCRGQTQVCCSNRHLKGICYPTRCHGDGWRRLRWTWVVPLLRATWGLALIWYSLWSVLIKVEKNFDGDFFLIKRSVCFLYYSLLFILSPKALETILLFWLCTWKNYGIRFISDVLCH